MNACKEIDPEFENVRDDARYLTQFYIESRYPDDYVLLRREDAQKAFEAALHVKELVLAKIFHCHQTIEKLLKTLIIHRGEVPIKTHDLPYLVQKTGINFPEELLTFINALNGHYQPARYPDIPLRGPAFSYTKRNTAAYITHTKKVFLWLEKKLIPKK